MKNILSRSIAITLAVCVVLCTMLVGVSATATPATPKVTTTNGVGGVIVDWNKVSGAVRYHIYRRGAGESSFTYIDTATTNSYFDKTVKSGQYYCYTVRAFNSQGGQSAYLKANTSTRKYVATPTIATLLNSTNGLTLTWKSVLSGATYRVYRRGEGQTTWTYLGTTTGTTYTDTKVSSGKYWRYTLRAVSGGYYSGYDYGTYTMRLANPYSIKTVNALDGVTVTWGKINGATAYRVYRRAQGQANWTYLGATSSTSYRDKTVASGIYYKYTVRATKGNVYSWFNDGSLIRFLKAPVVSGHTSSNKNLTIRWNKVDGASSYRVYRMGEGESWKLVTTVSGTSYTDSNVINNKYYRYTIRSINGNYISGYDNNGYLLKFIPGSEGSTNGSSSSGSSSTTNTIMTNPLAAYQKAAAEINKNGTAGYNLRQWERIESFTLEPDYSNVYRDLLECFLTTEDEAEIKVSEKGSAEAKRRMPLSNCTSAYVKSATAVKQGENYLVTIVMKDQTNPAKADTNGLNVMSNHLLYNEDVQDTVKNDSTVSKVVKSYSGNVAYKNYTIKALMTPSGKFISIDHYSQVVLSGNANLISGNSSFDCNMTLETQYSDFVY